MPHNDNDSDETLLSRTGNTHPGGKLTCRLDILVTEELEAAVTTLAGMHGVPKGEFARRLLERVVMGELHIMRRIVAQATHTMPCGNDGRNLA